jgi:hypothetical protein
VLTIARLSPASYLAERHDDFGGFEGADFWLGHAVFILNRRSLAGGCE